MAGDIVTIHLMCEECKNRNYSYRRNKKKHREKLRLRKYCPHCHRHTWHKEVK